MYETGSTQEELAETYDLENPVIEHTETKNFFDHTGLFHKGLNRALTEHELDSTLIPDDWWEVTLNTLISSSSACLHQMQYKSFLH